MGLSCSRPLGHHPAAAVPLAAALLALSPSLTAVSRSVLGFTAPVIACTIRTSPLRPLTFVSFLTQTSLPVSKSVRLRQSDHTAERSVKDTPASQCQTTLDSGACTRLMASSSAAYSVTPITPHFGGEIRGFDLKGTEPLPPEVVAQIKEDMKKFRVLVFKDQGKIPGERQVQISEQLGQIESTFYKHPRSPHPDVFRVSNDEREGCTGVGRTGWHVDGTFQKCPFKYQTMHFHAVAEGGDTWFVPLKELFEMQDEATRRRWDRLWMLTGRGGLAHPLVYSHPERGDTTMMLHCGRPFCAGWAMDDANPDSTARRVKVVLPAADVQDELTACLDAAVNQIGIKMRWEEGDFAINDNLGNVHYATPGTQGDPAVSGLRILHRTTIAGETTPEKADGRQSHVLHP